MIGFYFSVNNRETVIQLPVTPSEFTVDKPQGNETFETASRGWLKLIGVSELRSISFSSFFPVKDYPFLQNRSMWGFSYVEIIDTWKKEKVPIRLTIDTGGISFPCVVEDFKYTVGTTGDVQYDITLAEFPLLGEEPEGDDILSKEYEELKASIQDIQDRLHVLENPMIYNYVDQNMPEWARSTIADLQKKGYLNGMGSGLELNLEMLRLLKIMDRAGVFENVPQEEMH